MTQITLTLDMTPHNAAVLAEVLPRFEMRKPYSNEMIPVGSPCEATANVGDTSDKPEEKKAAPAKPKADKPKDAAPAAPAPGDKSTDKATSAKYPSMTDVRAIALKLSKAGRQDTLKALFAKYNADKLSGIAESDYPALLEDLEAANAES